MKIKFDTKTIEISKTFSDRASHFGSEAFQMLLEVRRALPDFEVVIKAAPRRCPQSYFRPTYDHMAACISAADPDGSSLEEFMTLRQRCSYAEIKKWFQSKFSEIQNFAA